MSGHGFSHELRQRQTQSLVLAPQLRHSLKILQVAALDLRSVIQEELQSNTTLEELPMEGVSLDKPADGNNGTTGEGDVTQTSAEAAPPLDHSDTKRDEMDFSKNKEFEILGKLDEDWRDHMASVGGSQPYTSEDAEKRQHFFDSLVSETSLQEHLMRQAELADLSPPVLAALQHLVGSLDDRGFLTQPPPDVALQTGLPLEAVQEALKALKTFEPAGIGAQDLADCLLAQLVAQGRGTALAARMIRDHFELLTRRRIPE